MARGGAQDVPGKRMSEPGATLVCRRCGIPTADPHSDSNECIDALRGVIARLEFHAETRAERSAAPKPGAKPRGGVRDRHDARMVVLDGERVTLTEGARRLGLSASALHFRILRRTCDPKYSEIDLRSVGADVPRVPKGAPHE